VKYTILICLLFFFKKSGLIRKSRTASNILLNLLLEEKRYNDVLRVAQDYLNDPNYKRSIAFFNIVSEALVEQVIIKNLEIIDIFLHEI
jgi:hypothetical protein